MGVLLGLFDERSLFLQRDIYTENHMRTGNATGVFAPSSMPIIAWKTWDRFRMVIWW